MSEAAVKIAIRGLSKSFGANHVLTELDLDIRDGESLVIIGASGTGKSVLLKNIVGILTPDSGSIKIAGEEVVGAFKLYRWYIPPEELKKELEEAGEYPLRNIEGYW